MMMKNIFKKILNLLTNITRFSIAIFRYPSLNWSSIGNVHTDCDFGSLVKINSPSCLTYVKIGYGTYLGHNSYISFTEIGKFCSIGPNIYCGAGIHPLHGLSTAPFFYSTLKQNGATLSISNKIYERKNVHIGNDVFIGANVTILDGIIIGNGAVVGAGSLINKNVPAYAIVGGVPARIIKFRFDDEKIRKLTSIAWWNWNTERLQEVESYFFDVETFIEKYYK